MSTVFFTSIGITVVSVIFEKVCESIDFEAGSRFFDTSGKVAIIGGTVYNTVKVLSELKKIVNI